LYMPLWSWEEIKCGYELCHPKKSEAVIQQRYSLFAGVPRFIFRDENTEEDLIEVIASADLPLIMACISQKKGAKNVSHYLIQMIPYDDYSKYTIDFLSSEISKRVIHQFQETRKNELIQFLRDSMAPSFASLSSYRGFVFENVAHNLCKGGKFRIYGPLGGPHDKEDSLIIPANEGKIVNGPSINSRNNIYYRPNSKTQAGFDSWMGNFGFFQMTTAQSHSINAYAMGAAMDLAVKLNCVHDKLYFVIPEERYQNFNRQPFKVTAERASKWAKNDSKQDSKQNAKQEVFHTLCDQLQQFLLVIDWKTSLK